MSQLEKLIQKQSEIECELNIIKSDLKELLLDMKQI